MSRHPYRADLLLLLAAAIWGSTFVAQRLGMASVGPLTYTGLRFLIGAAAILPLSWRRPASRGEWSAGFVLGLLVAGGVNLQQVGLLYTSVANAGFITGLYVVVVPLLGLLVGQRATAGAWLGALLACAGLYLLCVGEAWVAAWGDGLQLAGTLFWASQMLYAARATRRHDPIRLACIQFAACGALSLVPALAFEPQGAAATWQAMPAILYGGLLSVGCAYTLQLVAQRDVLTAHAAVIMSLEGVFAALAGWAVLGQTLSTRALAGAGLMILAQVVVQLWRAEPPPAAAPQPAR